MGISSHSKSFARRPLTLLGTWLFLLKTCKFMTTSPPLLLLCLQPVHPLNNSIFLKFINFYLANSSVPTSSSATQTSLAPCMFFKEFIETLIYFTPVPQPCPLYFWNGMALLSNPVFLASLVLLLTPMAGYVSCSLTGIGILTAAGVFHLHLVIFFEKFMSF